MQTTYKPLLLALAVLLAAGCGAKHDPAAIGATPALAETTSLQNATVFSLDNGMEVILVENHANPMVTAFTIVRTGSRNEDAASNGSAHFLEHLLFNGTKKRTQKQLYDEMDFYGGYNNANTGPDYTSYMILMPKDYIARGMDIQADMLFNSTLPPEKFEKERGIVIEEIGKDDDRPTYQVETHFLKTFFAGTPYQRPTLGTVATISHLQRERVWQFYKTWYVPNNMTLMVIGDFDTEAMIKLVQEKYGQAAPGPLPEIPKFHLQTPKKLAVQRTTAIGKFPEDKKYLTLGYPLPPPSTEGFQALELLAEFLGGKNTALLQTAFRRPENQDLVNDISTDLGFNRDFSYLKISAELPLPADEHRVIAIIRDSIKKLAREGVPEEAVQRALVQRAAQEIFTQEKLHYYGMMKAGYLAAGGYGFLRDYVAALQAVRAQDLRRMATATLVNATPVITLMQPRPPRDTTRAQQSARAWHSETLDNGMQVVIQYNTDSPVVGMHLLAKDPACLAGREKWGITDVLQRAMRTGGTKARPGPAFEDAVEALGAELKMHDNPWIPYDDYYHSPRFSYIRLKVVGTRFGDASTLLADVVRNARLNGPAVEDARKQVLSLAERAAASTPAVAKRLFYDNLFADNPGFGYELGLPEQVHNLTADAVRTFYRQLYAPGNLLLTISGNIPIEQAMAAVKRAFEGTWGEKVAVPEQPLQFSQFGRTVRQRVGKKQSYIYVANRFSVARDDLPALRVLMALFSDRLAFDLREKQGLAYSIGASARRLGGLDWYTVRMGTRPDNIDRALQGIRRKIADMRSSAIPEHEMRKTINSLLGRHGMRRLDRAGKAYTIAMQVLDGNRPETDDAVPDRLKRVTLADLRRLQKSVFSRDDHLVVIVE